MKVNEYKQGDIIFRQGDFSTVFYKLIGGSVGVYVGYGSENEKQLTTLHAGDYLGEMGVIEAYPRSATAVVLEDGTRMEEIPDKAIPISSIGRGICSRSCVSWPSVSETAPMITKRHAVLSMSFRRRLKNRKSAANRCSTSSKK